MARLLKGAPVAAGIINELTIKTQELKKIGIIPTLAILRIGSKGADMAYEKGAVSACKKSGVETRTIALPENVKCSDVLEKIEEINGDSSVHGCLLFRPIVNKEVEEKACSLLDPAKDMDGITKVALGDMFTGSSGSFPPCTAQACLEILDYYEIDVKSARVTVIGSSLVIGKPVASMLLDRFATLTVCNSETKDTAFYARNSDIIISAAGKAGLVNKSFAAPGQTILDVGINTDSEGRICGDVQFDEVEPIVSAITPVPGGVGAVTTAVLAKHVVEAAEKTRKE